MERQTERRELPATQIAVVRKAPGPVSRTKAALDLADRCCREDWSHTVRIVGAVAVETVAGVNDLVARAAMTLEKTRSDIVTRKPATCRLEGTALTCIHSLCSLSDGHFDRAQGQSHPPEVRAVGMAVESAPLSGQLVALVVARRGVAAQAPTGNWKDHAASSDDCRHPFHPDGPWRARPATDRRGRLDASEARVEGSRRIPASRSAITVDFA